MKRKFKLYEDKDTYKFTVVLSPKINKDMDVIYDINQNKTKELRKWYTYIDEVKEYVSKREIAWNYNKRNIKFPNGTYFIKDFDYNVGYTIKSDKTTHNPFVYIFMINLKPEEFGLKVPQTNESHRRRFALHLNESDFHHMNEIDKTPNKFRYMYFGFYYSSNEIKNKIMRGLGNEYISLFLQLNSVEMTSLLPEIIHYDRIEKKLFKVIY